MTTEEASGKPKKKSKSSTIESEQIDLKELLNPIDFQQQSDYKTLYDDDDDYPFIKLLEAINMRANDMPSHFQVPKMDLSALYCLGITIQEYARHLSTNLITQKRVSENLPALNTLFTQEEIEKRQLPTIIDKYKSLKQQRRHIEHPTSSPHNIRPNIELENTRQVKTKKSSMLHKLKVNDQEETYYETMLRNPEWQNLLRKNKDPEADAAAAKIRRENNDARAQKNKEERNEALRLKLEQGSQQVKHEEYLPPTPPADIFDMATTTPKKSTSKKKVSSSSASSPQKKKRKLARNIF